MVIIRSPLYPQGWRYQTSLVDSVEGRFCSGKDGISNIVQLIELQFLVDNVSRLADTCNQIRNLCKDGFFSKKQSTVLLWNT
jgi:hypothetical protein